jgi:hypothetical protein
MDPFEQGAWVNEIDRVSLTAFVSGLSFIDP